MLLISPQELADNGWVGLFRLEQLTKLRKVLAIQEKIWLWIFIPDDAGQFLYPPEDGKVAFPITLVYRLLMLHQFIDPP